MSKVTIFIEGIADKKFLIDYIKYLGIEDISEKDFVLVESNTEEAILRRKVDFERSTYLGKVSLLIFDADANFENTKAELERIRNKYSIDFRIFLFPNNSESGNLETLLEKIINPVNKPIFDCFESYQNCLSSKNEGYKVPATKTKIFAYVDTLITEREAKKAKEEYRDYLNVNHWDLNCAFLESLKGFLSENVI